MPFHHRRSKVIATALFVLGSVMVSVVLWLKATNVAAEPPSNLFQIVGVAFLLVAVATIALRPENRVSWLFGWVTLGLLGSELSDQWATYSYATGNDPLPLARAASWFSSWLWVPTFGPLATLLLLWFPDGKPPSPRWRPLQTALFVLFVFLGLIAAFGEDPESTSVHTNPLANDALTELIAPFLPLLGGFFPALVSLCVISLIVRFRRAHAVERQQLKLFMFAAASLALYMIVSTALDGVLEFPAVIEVLAFAGLPVAVGVAILRYRLYDIDLIINRTLVYGALTAVLAGTYVGLVFLFQRALAPVTRESDLAIAASTLAVAALFRPVRARVQAFIDRRFYRRKFDVEQTLESFSAGLRDEVDLGALSFRLTSVVAETMQPVHISLWLKGPQAS